MAKVDAVPLQASVGNDRNESSTNTLGTKVLPLQVVGLFSSPLIFLITYESFPFLYEWHCSFLWAILAFQPFPPRLIFLQ